MMRPPRLASVLLLIGLAIAGCGDDGGGGTSEEPESDGPLAEFLGWDETGRGEQPEVTEAERQRHYQIQDLVVACMTEAGFEYTPEPFYGDQAENFEDPFAEVWQMQEDEPERFAREYGYGITTLDYESAVPETPDETDDPNLAYRESLSPAAQEEYDRALWGAVEEVEPAEEGDEAEPVEPGGCQNDAFEQVYGDQGEGEQQFEELFAEFDTLYQRIEDDPRMDGARQAWIVCMAAAGYPDLEDLYSGQTQVSERQSELYGWEDEGPVDLPAPIEEGEETGGGQAEEAPSPAPEPDPAAVEELRQFERDMAVADYTCKQEHGVDETERAVRDEHEQQFIDEHRAELEAYRDWMNEQGIAG